MIGWQHRDQRLLRQHLEDDTLVVFLGTEKGDVQLPPHQCQRELRRGLRAERDLDVRGFLAQDAQELRQPHDLQPDEESHREERLLRTSRLPGPLGRRLDLKQRQSRVIEKHASGGGQRHAAGLALQQRNADFGFEIADLPAERWLRGVQSPLGSGQQAAFFSDGNEIAQMPELHAPSYIFQA